MAINVMILGASGTGKSASMRNFNSEDVALVNVCAKPLPFRKKQFETLDSDNYAEIKRFLKKTARKIIVIDDAQYLMADEYMRRASERGFDKFTDIGQNFWNLIKFCEALPSDKVVYFLQHTEISSDDKTVKAKTIGKMLDEKITLEGLFSIVLRTSVDDGHYTFHTRNNGSDTVKSPIGMFDKPEIDNDLAKVDEVIRAYYSDIYAEQDSYRDSVAVLDREPEQDRDTERISKAIDDSEAPGGTPADTPLSKWGELKIRLDDAKITVDELKKFVVSSGVVEATVEPSDYEDDFIDYLLANFEKLKKNIKGGK